MGAGAGAGVGVGEWGGSVYLSIHPRRYIVPKGPLRASKRASTFFLSWRGSFFFAFFFLGSRGGTCSSSRRKSVLVLFISFFLEGAFLVLLLLLLLGPLSLPGGRVWKRV